MEDHEKLKDDYINASRKIRRQRVDLDKAYGMIEQLKKENEELRVYKDTYFSLKLAGVDLPHVKSV
ncbi:hypothetical protein [Metabacillus sp. FJAT-53654]|uniref:Uncharacterized protein n=1 Tax=Metabacillus rhizosphaerae TaxID=3117747 RepID=A0ABZ2MZ10_9BACI